METCVGLQAGVTSQEEFIESAEGHRLFVRSWQPLQEASSMLAIVHGFNSHSAYYERFAGIMAHAGITTCALDLRGRGRSSGPRCFVRQFAEYVSDIEAFVSALRARAPALPLFMLGHGVGGVAACLYALDHPQDLTGLICESFALQVPAPGAEVHVLKALAFLAPQLPVLRLRNAQFSREPLFLERMDTDPLIQRERQPARTLVELMRASSRLRASLDDITLPLLILHGSADSVTLPSGSEIFTNTRARVTKHCRSSKVIIMT